MSTIGNQQDYIDNYLKELSTRSVRYGQDYLARSLPSPLRIKRKPTKKQPDVDPAQSEKSSKKEENQATVELLIKILKPSSQFRITRLQLDDTILNLKQRIYQQQMIPVKQQRLLLKGKVLNDEKSLGDYQMTNDTTLHLMVSKPPAGSSSSSSPLESPAPATSHELSSNAQTVIKTDAFWNIMEQSLGGQLGAADAKLVMDTWKKALSQ